MLRTGRGARETGAALSRTRGPGGSMSLTNEEKAMIEQLAGQMLRNIRARKIVSQQSAEVKKEGAPREQGASTGSQQPPAPVVQQDKDPLREIARIREQEQKEIMESREKMRVFELEHKKKMAEIQRKGNEALRQARQKIWRR
jgi:hypothetical protein